MEVTEHNMNHMPYLAPVQEEDLRVLRHKEATYQGSWKRAGGVSAWYMIRRKIDRLLVMLGRPGDPGDEFDLSKVELVAAALEADTELPAAVTPAAAATMVRFLRRAYTAEDLFAKMMEDPTGADGSVRAEVRDLRRYLTLVEAEVMRREARAQPKVPQSFSSQHTLNLLAGSSIVAGDLLTGICESIVPEYTGPGTPEDGGQHANLTPWVVGKMWRIKHPRITSVDFDVWWRRVGIAPTIWVLEAAVEQNACPLPGSISYLYDQQVNPKRETRFQPISEVSWWVIDISRCPPDARAYFPHLRVENNQKEWEDLLGWAQALYVWNDGETKWKLKPEHAAWAEG